MTGGQNRTQIKIGQTVSIVLKKRPKNRRSDPRRRKKHFNKIVFSSPWYKSPIWKMALLAGLSSFTVKNSDSPCILKSHIQPFITGKVSGTEQEQNDPSLMDSFCHLIIAQEATTEATWIILIDQGEDTGVPTTNCIQYIIPRICERFKLKIANLRVFEVWPYHQGDPRLKYTEVVISDISFDDDR